MYGDELKSFLRTKKTLEGEMEDLFSLVTSLADERDEEREKVKKLEDRVTELEDEIEKLRSTDGEVVR